MKRARGGKGGDTSYRFFTDREERSGGPRRVIAVRDEAWSQGAKELSTDLVHWTVPSETGRNGLSTALVACTRMTGS